jgi:hypothetical protein
LANSQRSRRRVLVEGLTVDGHQQAYPDGESWRSEMEQESETPAPSLPVGNNLTPEERVELLRKVSTAYSACFEEDDQLLTELKNEWPK